MTSAAQTLARLFPSEVQVAGGAFEGARGKLYPEERELVARSIAKRRREFEAGRLFAREALAKLGVPDVAIPAEDRRPIWPTGTLGTISHARDRCGVAVARAGELTGLGLDIEEHGRVTEPMHRQVLTPVERDWLQGFSMDDRARLATIVFSAKEAFYKSLAEIRTGWVGFQEVRIDIEDDDSFSVIPESEEMVHALRPRTLVGRYVSSDDWVWTGVTLRDERV